jgi:hypothetical protein
MEIFLPSSITHAEALSFANKMRSLQTFPEELILDFRPAQFVNPAGILLLGRTFIIWRTAGRLPWTYRIS